jgi:long-chain acyl-CoA synthetase
LTQRFETLVGLLRRAHQRHASAPLFGTKRGGEWRWASYREFCERVDAFRGGLASAGLKRGDRVAMISDNRVEWAVTAYACFGLGAALVPMYEAQSARDWAFIIEDCGAKLLVCAGQDIFARCEELPSKIDALQQRIGIGLPASHPNSYARLLAKGRDEPVEVIEPEPDDTACIIYTSGTTGDPKGVVLSHLNLCSNINMVLDSLPLTSADRSLSFLPWAHSFGQTCELHTMIALGGSMALAESIAKVPMNLSEIRPTVLISVPRIFTTMYHSVQRQMAQRPAFIRKTFETGMRLEKEKRHRDLKFAERIALSAAQRLVFSAIRDRFGGKLRYAFSGGAALAKEVAQFIDDLGITVFEGYGLTEASPVVSTNRPGARRIGSVGKPLDGVRVTIDHTESDDPDDGEIVVYGPNVMAGYWQRPEATTQAFSEDGGLRTGDLGRIDADGFLYITGRLGQQYKLLNGKYVVPAPLEERLKLSPYISNVMIYGEGRDHNVGLVVVDLDALHRWTDDRDLTFKNTAQLLASERVRSHLKADIGERSAGFKPYERIKDLVLIDQDFTTDNGMLTPTFKIKRAAVLDKYGDRLADLYA